MSNARPFDYHEAFSRNIGWVTEHEQAVLRRKRIAIAGLGGVGGSHLLTLTRLGIGSFHISDFDRFDLVNFNRQAGASMSSLDQPKVDVLTKMAMDINPELEIKQFPDGVNAQNVDAFLDGVDLYVDGLDFFAVKARRSVFGACERLGIPATTAAPLGMGVSALNFVPGGVSFEQYFRLEGQEEAEQLMRFLLGLSPNQLQMRALVDDTRIDLAAHKGPSTPMGCDLCAGVAATQALKLLLNRGPVITAPRALHFDAYNNRMQTTWRPGGSDHPVQRLVRAIARRKLSARLDRIAALDVGDSGQGSAEQTPIQRVLDKARWAPSGDNTQPWRFTLTGDHSCVVHASDTRDWCVYDLQGRASQIAVGAMLETLKIAASHYGFESQVHRRPESPETNPEFEVTLNKNADCARDPLFDFIEHRVTQRRAFSAKPIAAQTLKALEASLPAGYGVHWLQTPEQKRRMAKLLFLNAGIRLTIPEAYRVHKEIIEWDAQFSDDRIPDRAVGLDPVALKMMKWAMQDWTRVRFLNNWLAGTWLPRIQLDFIPALRSGAHFVLLTKNPPRNIDDYLAAGSALQRLWLTTSLLGLQFQPEMTPLIFAGYIRDSIEFTQSRDAINRAERLHKDLAKMLGPKTLDNGVFMGRIGYGSAPTSRSRRLSLKHLVHRD